MTGRVTMLGISRWTNKGGSYRTLQRFFAATIPWLNILWLLFLHYIYKKYEVYLLAGDESVVTKAGNKTHGLDRFFSGLYQKPVLGLAFFVLSLVSVNERRSYPISISQVVRTDAEKALAKHKKKKKTKKGKKANSQSKGRPKGSKNKDKSALALSPELTRIDALIAALLQLIAAFLPLTYLVLDGHFGHNQVLLMARKNNLHLISKLQKNSALHEKFDGVYSGHGPRPIYGNRLDYQNLPSKYLKKTTIEKKTITRYYQCQMLHKEFAQPLNVVIIVKYDLKTQKKAHVILFTSDLILGYELVVDYYSLRFQIEFNFRDAKGHWGFEDFMNQTKQGVTNAANLSFFMVNLSQILLKDSTQTSQSVLDLKSRFLGLKYVKNTLKMLLEKPEPILLEEIFRQVTSLGCIHPLKVNADVP
jgi:putative transposase